MKTKLKTDWEARFACEKPLQIKKIDKPFAGIPAGATMLIVTPRMVDDIVRRVPSGSLLAQSDIRKMLATEYGADYACPVTTGIALRVVSERAYAKSGSNESDITPFWRAVDPSSDLGRKLECGVSFLIKKRNEEAEQGGTGQPATRSVLESKGGDKPQPEAEGRSM